MKRKYIIPQMMVESFSASSNILAGSPTTGGGNYNAGETGGTTSTSGGVSSSTGSGLKQHSKQFDAWSTWDD